MMMMMMMMIIVVVVVLVVVVVVVVVVVFRELIKYHDNFHDSLTCKCFERFLPANFLRTLFHRKR